MPQLPTSSSSLQKRASRFWTGFSDFALQDNVLEVAVGLMYFSPTPSPIMLQNLT